MAHGLTGTRRDRLGAFAERFVAAGTAAFVFDYRGFGDSTGEPDLFEVERQLDDWRAAIAFARTLPGIDADRVGTFGSSFGGGHALAAAAEGRRVAAVISQVPLLDRDSQTYTGWPRSGYTATDLNGHTGFQTVEEGAVAIVRLACIGPDGPTGGYFDREGAVAW
jgi:dienelactone hydrolase